ncbi:hypothetical protein [Lactiplantibacillus fabifermentans]|uniref:Uncharacterized protein n=2 Tax=Lactiplantibacillus fabifermentans TaxID=483011 RepID=A0A0R2NSA3_9LACO|nr:hypothetical protein [Lactiplantibacillus fabifermentans]ETY72921.1 hypothetical protein LFAB_14955 [Lactiplantibacillus fabifermentans T30PCM01]KRO27296.1 hypothetical protein DY78_GL000147 [Lactiplantibacillus fabifermentans DSM 21115]
MTKPLKPADMQSLLTHDWRYQRAAAVVKGQWLPIIAEEEHPFRQQIQPEDLQFARELIASDTLTSQFDFNSYAGVQAMRQYFGSQLSSTGQHWLVSAYQ